MLIKTDSGFTCNIDTDLLDDWDFMEAAFKVSETKDRTEALRLCIYMLEHIFEPSEVERLKEHIRKNDNGRLRTTRMEAEINDIMLKINESKNSSPSPD